MTLPFIAPIIEGLGLDLLWFGVVLIILMEVGQVTPPFGLNLFVLQGVAGKESPMIDIFLGSMPFLVCTLIVLVTITIAPWLVSLLPTLLGL